ncbi:MAG: SusC/RagA family TonB-linked outer membrane protein [Flavobacteriaceae bacterium]|nr:SusC/RagA family TonB-linked outer membrane protein [Flavobacteriaceae bacterium]
MKTNLSVLKGFLAFLILLGVGTTYAQDSKKEMYGVVKDQNGQPLLGVAILLKDNSLTKVKKGVTTDLEGKYRLVSKDGKGGIVVFSYIGMKTKKIPFRKGEFNLVLEEDAQALDEVVISTGYQNMKASEMVGSAARVDMKNLETRIAGGGRNIVTTLEGLSNTLVAASNPEEGANKRLLIRGVSTIQGNSSPLIVVDGFPYSGDLESLNPYDIENITMLKDAASAAIYGASSGNGVIIVTTKRGKGSGLKFQYNTNFEISEKKDIEYYLNRASSKELVGLYEGYVNEHKDQLESFQSAFQKDPNANPSAKSKVEWLMLENKEGRLSDAELTRQLTKLKNTDNINDLKKLFLQNPLYREHNLSVDYVKKGVKLRSSLNYNHNDSGEKRNKSQGVRYALNSYIDVSDKVRMDLSTNFNLSESEQDLVSLDGFTELSAYERLFDDNGNPVAITKGRDPYSIKYLNDLGLLDETYIPAEEVGRNKNNSKNWGARLQGQLRVALTNSLSGTLGFSINKSSAYSKTLTDKNSWALRTEFNSFTKKDTINGKIAKGKLLELPYGDQISEFRVESTNYLLRGQLQYNKIFNELHKVTALLGSEIRAGKRRTSSITKLGYNPQTLGFENNLNYVKISQEGVEGTFGPSGYGYKSIDDRFGETEDRFFSLYGNLSYNYDSKYILHGSIRVDQSNLFGTDPRYRYKPFWSAGAKWRIAEEDFFDKEGVVNRLDIQSSYGINGNVSNRQGPFDVAKLGRDFYIREEKAEIIMPKVTDLRWEKTNTFNVGLQAGFFRDRIGLTFDYYVKNTTDVIGVAEIDPTLGFNSVTKNIASLVNRGYELSLNTTNVRTNNFLWSTYLGLNFNKSLVKENYVSKEITAYNTAGMVKNLSGYETSSIFLFKDAGVNEEGYGIVEKSDGTKLVMNYFDPDEEKRFKVDRLTHDDMVHAGTIIPKFVARLTNNLSYKDFTLSLMFIYQGGHILLKDSYYGQHIYLSSANLRLNKDIAKAWKEKGDEKKEGVLPKMGSDIYFLSGRMKRNVIKGDYLRLRDVVLSYNLPQSFISKNKYIKDCRIDLRGKNLYLWTKNKEGIDPEAHGIKMRFYPVVKSVSLGLNLIF